MPIAEIAQHQYGLEVFGHIPEDGNITRFDLAGKPLIDLPDISPSVVAVREILQKGLSQLCVIGSPLLDVIILTEMR